MAEYDRLMTPTVESFTSQRNHPPLYTVSPDLTELPFSSTEDILLNKEL